MTLKSDKDLPAPVRSTWLKAMSAYELKNYGYAIQLAQTVLKQVPDFLAGRQLARRSAIAKNGGKKGFFSGISGSSFSTMKVQGLLKKDPAAAMDAVEKILEGDPYSVQANQLLKDSAVAMNLIDVAAFALETIIEGNPKETKTLHELAKLYIAHDEPEKAVEVYKRITDIIPNDLGAIKGGKDAAAKASMKQGGWETADSYRDLIKDKDTAEALEQQNRVVKDEDTINSLIAELHKQIELEPQNVDKALRIAELHEQKEDVDSAISWYEYASALQNGADPAIVGKVAALGLKRIENCISARENYIAENGMDNDESRQYASEIEELKRQHAEFELDGVKRAVERNPTDLAARYKLGEILLRAGHHDKAIPELQKALQNPHARLKAMNLLAQCYMAMNMFDLAAKRLSDAASEINTMDGTKKEIVYNLGLVYEKMGQKQKSIECFKQIYEVDYGYRDVAARVEGSYGN